MPCSKAFFLIGRRSKVQYLYKQIVAFCVLIIYNKFKHGRGEKEVVPICG